MKITLRWKMISTLNPGQNTHPIKLGGLRPKEYIGIG